MTDKKRIGFLTYWGWSRGQAYLNLANVKMIQDDYDVFILKQFNNPISDEFKDVKVTITETPNYEVNSEIFKIWVTDNKLDAVVFTEYKQWTEDTTNDLIPVCKELGVKAYATLVWEKFTNIEDYAGYDRLIAPTVSYEKFFRRKKYRKHTYVPMSIDFNEFPKKDVKMGKPFTFFHPGGFGGVHNRKNTDVVVEAFRMLNREDTKLIITTLKPVTPELRANIPDNIELIEANLSRQEMIDLYYKADITVLPSKWETIGIPILESLAAGTPVITTNMPPMNEFIRNGLNGYVCTAMPKWYDGIHVQGGDVDAPDLCNKMEASMNEVLYPILANNARKISEQLYDIEKNKKYFLDFLKGDLK